MEFGDNGVEIIIENTGDLDLAQASLLESSFVVEKLILGDFTDCLRKRCLKKQL